MVKETLKIFSTLLLFPLVIFVLLNTLTMGLIGYIIGTLLFGYTSSAMIVYLLLFIGSGVVLWFGGM